MNKATNIHSAQLPVQYAGLLLRLINQSGGSSVEAMAQFQLSPEILRDESNLLSFKQIYGLLSVLKQYSGRADLGLWVGEQQTITTWGRLGYLMLSARTLHDAIHLGITYSSVTARLVNIEMDKSSNELCTLNYSPLFANDPWWRFSVESSLASIQIVFSALAGTPLRCERIELDYPDPGYAERYRELFECEILFDQPTTRSIVPLPQNIDLPTHDPASAGLFLQRVQERHQQVCPDNLTQLARHLLYTGDGYFLSQAELATTLNMSPRSLSRKLHELDVTYRDLVDDRKQELAENKLRTTRLSIDQVAQLTGYENRSNFSKAFARWTGLSPHEYRVKYRRH